MNCLKSFQAHNLPIKSLAVDEINDCFISSSIEGDIKIWSLKDFSLINGWAKVHVKVSKSHPEKTSTSKVLNYKYFLIYYLINM